MRRPLLLLQIALAVLVQARCAFLDGAEPVEDATLGALISTSGSSPVAPAAAQSAQAPLEAPPLAPSLPADLPEINLVGAVPLQVVLSSVSMSSSGGASSLTDGQLETSWRSEAGAMTGEWLAFLIPESAELRSIRLAPGPPSSTGSREGFSQSARVRRLLVTRDGETISELTLDIDDPSMQAFSVSGPPGLYKLTVIEVAEGVRSGSRQLALPELEIWGVATSELRQECSAGCSVESRVGALRALEAPALASKGMTLRLERDWEPQRVNGAALPMASEDRAFARVVQGSHDRPVRPIRLLELVGAFGDRVFVMLSLVDDLRSASPVGPSRRPGCADADAILCPSLYLTRVSVPARSIPSVDGELRLATDVCSVESQLTLRDLDGDDREEVIVRFDYRTHEICRVGAEHLITEVIADLETLEEQFRGELMRDPAGQCGVVRSSTRTVRDLNGDGRHDFLIRFQLEGDPCDRREAQRGRTFIETEYYYDAGGDLWRLPRQSVPR